MYWGSQAGNGTKPATVDFAPIKPQSYQLKEGAKASRFSVSGTNATTDSIGNTNFTGDLTTVSSGDPQIGPQEVAVVVVLRDETGAILCGTVSFVSTPAEGESTSFEVSMFGAPEFASYDVCAMQW